MALQGMGLDGRAVSAIEISLKVRAENVQTSPTAIESAGFNIQFFDGERNPIGIEIIGPWKGTFAWKPVSEVVRIPPKAREAIVRVGLNGATGELSIDDVRLTPRGK
jgi:protein-L-isoaspartate(D-aspartate) O-methyltransferase